MHACVLVRMLYVVRQNVLLPVPMVTIVVNYGLLD